MKKSSAIGNKVSFNCYYFLFNLNDLKTEVASEHIYVFF